MEKAEASLHGIPAISCSFSLHVHAFLLGAVVASPFSPTLFRSAALRLADFTTLALAELAEFSTRLAILELVRFIFDLALVPLSQVQNQNF